MDVIEKAFRLLPDTIIITDVYWYVLDYNRKDPFWPMRKGDNLNRYMADCKSMPNGRYPYDGKVYQRSTTPVFERGIHVGYVVYLADVTEKERLIEKSRIKSAELEELTGKQAQANAELEEYVRQAEALGEYEEQVRIARSIHDDAGHAITMLNTISQMCLQLKDSDPAQYHRLIEEGIALCDSNKIKKQDNSFSDISIKEMLEKLRDDSAFPIELRIQGEEPQFAKPLHKIIEKICQEAYHNTLSHSMADRITIEVNMEPTLLSLRISDNGSFRGTLEKGFGLCTMEESVRASGGTISFEAEEGKGFGIVTEWRAEE